MDKLIKKDYSEHIESIIKRLTLEEKIAQMTCASGKEFVDDSTGEWIGDERALERLKLGLGQITRLGGITKLSPANIARLYNNIQRVLLEKTHSKIPVINREECLAGYMVSGASIFPQMISAASSWDRELIYQMADIIRREMRSVGATHAMAPDLDVVRDPRWGRVEETFGEDPYLVSSLGCKYIDGLQGDELANGVASCGKHFLAHGIPEGGTNWSPVMIGDRELREVFGRPFEAGIVCSSMASVMAAYHEMDGIPVHSSQKILNDLLKENMGFEGVIISDAMGIQTLNSYHHIADDFVQAAAFACNAGVNIELPFETAYGEPLLQAVKIGLVSEDTIDQRVREILALKFKLGLFSDPYVDVSEVSPVFHLTEANNISKKIAQESIVLLKNMHNLLPLPKEKIKIAVIGPTGDDPRYLLGDYSFPAHAEGIGTFGDESLPNLYTVKYAAQEAWDAMSVYKAIEHKLGLKSTANYAKGCDHLDPDKSGFKEARRLAKKASVIILTLGGKSGMTPDSTSGEMRDRADIRLPGVQEELIKELAKQGKPMIGVLLNGRPYALDNVIDCFDALVEAWLPGNYGGEAIANVLFGDYNPSGKTPITFPRSLGQIPIYYNHKPSGMHSQFFGDYVDLSVDPLFPFGFGLSFTKFSFDGLLIDSELQTNSDIDISFYVKNVGDCNGDVVVQCYVRDLVASVTRPVKELKGFDRISLAPDQVKKVTFNFPSGLLGFFNRDMNYVVEPGEFQIMIGEDSEQIALQAKIKLIGPIQRFPKQVFFSTSKSEVVENESEELFQEHFQHTKLSINSTVREIIENHEGKKVLAKTFGPLVKSPQIKFAYDMRLKDLQKHVPKILTDEKLKTLDSQLQSIK